MKILQSINHMKNISFLFGSNFALRSAPFLLFVAVIYQEIQLSEEPVPDLGFMDQVFDLLLFEGDDESFLYFFEGEDIADKSERFFGAGLLVDAKKFTEESCLFFLFPVTFVVVVDFGLVHSQNSFLLEPQRTHFNHIELLILRGLVQANRHLYFRFLLSWGQADMPQRFDLGVVLWLVDVPLGFDLCEELIT